MEDCAEGPENPADNRSDGLPIHGAMVGRMPADMAFAMASQTCTACHGRFPAEGM